MKWSNYYIKTLKESPNDAEIASHKLLIRAGMIKKLASGLYSYLPLFVKTLRKVENILREELENKNAIELLMPVILPAELWKESGRWDQYGKELWRVFDRKDGEFALAPTHEEVITSIVRNELTSYKELPKNLFQIQTKVRDEIRPRFGLMRAREFVMKDGYSFHASKESLDVTYQDMYEAYTNIFNRCGLKFKTVEADTGAIGGSDSHEFMVLAESGEDEIASCTSCDYAANVEKATTIFETVKATNKELEKVETIDIKTIEELESFFKIDKSNFVKSVIVKDEEEKIYLFLVRGDYDVNEIAINNEVNKAWDFAEDKDIEKAFGCVKGYIGPVNISEEIIVVADNSIKSIEAGICGSNKANYHLSNFNYSRDLADNVTYKNIIKVKADDNCPRCSGKLEIMRGIEVGHIFKLGNKYSESMGAKFKNENARDVAFEMGCYGIGVSRVVQSAIEQNNDEYGIKWTKELAPFLINVIALDMKKEETATFSTKVYEELKSKGYDVIFDNRNERAGFKFKDAELIGFPINVIIGARGLKDGTVELKNRQTNEKITINKDDIIIEVEKMIETIF